MVLADVFPRTEILAAVPAAQFEVRTLKDLARFAVEEPSTLMGLGFASWDHALSCGKHNLDPEMLAAPIQAEDPMLIRYVAEALGRPVLLDFHHVNASLPGQNEAFATTTLAHLYPNHVHIGDVLLLDPSRPRTGPRWIDQKFESLRLFPAFLERLRTAALELGAEKLTLTAANRSLRLVFERYGFRMADTFGARYIEAHHLDSSFPMELPLA